MTHCMAMACSGWLLGERNIRAALSKASASVHNALRLSGCFSNPNFGYCIFEQDHPDMFVGRGALAQSAASLLFASMVKWVGLQCVFLIKGRQELIDVLPHNASDFSANLVLQDAGSTFAPSFVARLKRTYVTRVLLGPGDAVHLFLGSKGKRSSILQGTRISGCIPCRFAQELATVQFCTAILKAAARQTAESYDVVRT